MKNLVLAAWYCVTMVLAFMALGRGDTGSAHTFLMLAISAQLVGVLVRLDDRSGGA